MKMRFINLFLFLVLFQNVWSLKSTFYGYIYKYPITMEIDINDDGDAKGYYYYNKQKKKLTLTGKITRKDKKIFLKTNNNMESFQGYLMNNNESRIIGRWKYKNKNLPFELQRERFTTKNTHYYNKTGLNIDPIADEYFETKEMEIFTDTAFIFSYYSLLGSNQISFDAHPNITDVTNMQKMIELANKIRSESNDGYSYSLIVWRNLLVTFLQLHYTPEYFLKYLNNENILAKERKNKNDYFTRWAFTSCYTFDLYKEFKKENSKSKKKAISFFINKNFTKAEAEFLASYTEYLIQNRAYGSSPSSDFCEISDLLQRIIAGDKTAAILAKITAKKYDNQELFLCLKASILLKGNKQIIKKLLEKVEDINSFDESPLSCAVQDLEMLKFLLNQKICSLDINHKNLFGKTPLFYAIQYSNHESVAYLLQKGANVNQKYATKSEIDMRMTDNEIYHAQRTPLMHAAQNSDVAMLKLLLNNGANLKDLDEIDNNALDYAISEKKEENIKFLQKLKLSSTGNWNNYSSTSW